MSDPPAGKTDPDDLSQGTYTDGDDEDESGDVVPDDDDA